MRLAALSLRFMWIGSGGAALLLSARPRRGAPGVLLQPGGGIGGIQGPQQGHCLHAALYAMPCNMSTSRMVIFLAPSAGAGGCSVAEGTRPARAVQGAGGGAGGPAPRTAGGARAVRQACKALGACTVGWQAGVMPPCVAHHNAGSARAVRHLGAWPRRLWQHGSAAASPIAFHQPHSCAPAAALSVAARCGTWFACAGRAPAVGRSPSCLRPCCSTAPPSLAAL